MSEFKGTPGKWIQSHRPIPNDKKGMYATQVYTEDGETIATLAWYPMPPVVEETVPGKRVTVTGTYREANSKLIAAAPELLEALIKINDFISTNKDKNYMIELLNREVPDLDKLISKATE